MVIYDFNLCDREGRAQMVRDHGDYLAQRLEGTCRIVLYNLGSFFAEIRYHATTNHLLEVNGFVGKSRLEPYLPLIDLHDLS